MPVCGEHPTIKGLVDYEQFCGLTAAQTVMNPDEVTVQDMKRALDDPRLGIKVLDVREPDEYQIAHIDGVPLLPMSKLEQRYAELDPSSLITSIATRVDAR